MAYDLDNPNTDLDTATTDPDGGADDPAPAPDPVTQEDVSGSDRHLENQADEIAERVREGGIPVPTTAADPTAGADPTAVADSTAAADDTGDEMVCSGDQTGGGTVCRM